MRGNDIITKCVPRIRDDLSVFMRGKTVHEFLCECS